MIFTSATFSIFLLSVFVFYWFIFSFNLKAQNIFLLISSYFFYGWWDWRFLFLLFFISASNYLIGLGIRKYEKKVFRKLFFITGLIINIGTLVIFKYFNFFIEEFTHIFLFFGIRANFQTLNIILPVGISFYTFLSISYLIDVYQNKLIAVRNFVDALLTFGFFPIILAGPIQRPISLLPQIQSKRIFNYSRAINGSKQILWGVFMKIVIADTCGVAVNTIFSNFSGYSGSTLLYGIFLFTVQIYSDFAGYSNIAIGIGKLLGFDIMQNFAYPYFSRDMKEFWKKWNISLTTWFRDYVFLPVAYAVSRRIKAERLFFIKTDFIIYFVGIVITWGLTGLWHGANYTFILWGFIQGFFLLLNHVFSKPRKRLLSQLNVRHDNLLLASADYVITFMIIMFSWVFFRADNFGHAMDYISGIFSSSLFTIPQYKGSGTLLITLISIIIFFLFEFTGRKNEFAISELGKNWPRFLRWSMYYGLMIAIIWFSEKEQQFIYFQF